MTKPITFTPDIKNTDRFRKYYAGPFVLILRAMDEPWAPENIIPELRIESRGDQIKMPYAVCRAIRGRADPTSISIALDLSGVPGLVGMSTAEQLKTDLSGAQDLAAAIKHLIETECPGLNVRIEP